VSDPADERYRRAFRETATPALLTDENFEIFDANAAALTVTGYEREALLGRTSALLVDDPLVFEEMMSRLLDGGAWSGEFDLRTRTGELVFGEGSAQPLIVDGETVGYITVFRDVTERRRYEQTMQVFNRVLRHNLRNDANVIAGALDTIAERLDADDVVRDAIAMAQGRIESMLDRAETTRNLSDLLGRRRDLTIRPVRVDHELARGIERVDTEGVDLTIDWTHADAQVLADDLLRVAVEALVENAIEHNDKPDPTVSVAVEREGENRLRVVVRDNGPGIPPGSEDRIFGRTEDTPLFHSRGLELFFVDRLLNLYGGEARVRPSEDAGSRFELSLRLAGRPPEDPDAG